MKKLISIMSTIAVLFSMINGAFAVDDIMTPVNEYEKGTSIPSYDSVWNLKSSYTGSFDFNSKVYTNYCFTGKSTINVGIQSESDNSAFYIKTFDVTLYQRERFGDSFVGEFECLRDGSASKSFSVTSANRYFIELSKAPESTNLVGTLWVSGE